MPKKTPAEIWNEKHRPGTAVVVTRDSARVEFKATAMDRPAEVRSACAKDKQEARAISLCALRAVGINSEGEAPEGQP